MAWRLSELEGLSRLFADGISEGVVGVEFPDQEQAIYMRRQTSDFKSFLQIFVHKEYDAAFNQRERISPGLIVDLGAYIGLSAIYFRMVCPSAKMVCVEPQAGNLKLLEMNAPWAEKLAGAAWPVNAPLGITVEFDGDWGFRVDEVSDGGLRAVTMQDIVRANGRIGLLKVDIEGAEKRLFSENTDWVNDVDAVACETHDRYNPGCYDAYNALFPELFFARYKVRETEVAIRK